MTTPYIEPAWPAPETVRAVSTLRTGGASFAPYASFNLGDHVGDDPAMVATNRAALAAESGAGAIQWLQQVHGTEVLVATGDMTPEADASWTTQPDLACSVMTADCLPVLFCDRAGTTVAAAHAGWRGLCSGVLEATVAAMGRDPAELLAWLGPAIGPEAFEVGPEVRAAFLERDREAEPCFKPSRGLSGAYLADLYALAHRRLNHAGVTGIYGGDFCTFTEGDRFFSYRRDGQTGRMASLIWLNP